MKGALFAVLLAGGAVAAPPPTPSAGSDAAHVVVLRDGRAIASRTRPLMAFGEVRYTDAAGGLRVLSASRVDAKATLEHPANQRDAAERGTFNVCGRSEPLVPITVVGGPRAKPKVTLYSATWCGVCPKTKDWLASQGVEYDLVEVDLLPKKEQQAAMAAMKSLSGRVAYPTLDVGGSAIVGFNPARMNAMLRPRRKP